MYIYDAKDTRCGGSYFYSCHQSPPFPQTIAFDRDNPLGPVNTWGTTTKPTTRMGNSNAVYQSSNAQKIS